MQKAAFSIINYQFDKVSIDLNNHNSKDLSLSFDTSGIYFDENQNFELRFVVKVAQNTDKNLSENIVVTSEKALNTTISNNLDITGKLIQVENANGELSLSKPFNHAEGFYIAKIKLENEGIATQKLINRE